MRIFDFNSAIVRLPGRSVVDGLRANNGPPPAYEAVLAELRRILAKDVRAGFEGDPAATGLDEVIFCYPGLYAITIFRIANLLHRAGAPLIPRMMTELAHSRTGVDIHPGATIGESFFIDHGTGVVIGETTLIGDRVRLYQGVTLGALSLSATSVVMPFHYTMIVWALILGWAFWNEVPDLQMLTGAAIIVASGLYILYREHRLAQQQG